MIGKVSNITQFGVFMTLNGGQTGLLRWADIPKSLQIKRQMLLPVQIDQIKDDKLSLSLSQASLLDSYGQLIDELEATRLTLQEANERIDEL